MDELISRDLAVELLEDAKVNVKGFKFGKTILSEYSKQIREGYIDVIKNVPPADAKYVKHGIWFLIGKTEKGSPIRKCSECLTKRTGRPRYKYCPDCGTEMSTDCDYELDEDGE